MQLTRRELLVLASGSAVLASCSPASPPEPAPSTFTVDALLSEKPFYIAHRGSMDNWPEHTAEAYSQAIAHGAKALEVSVCATSDGELVCHHDANTLRMTGQDLVIAETPYSRLQELQIDARPWLGPNSYLLPIPMLRDVLDAHARTHVIFIEDKQGTNTAALLEMMEHYPNPQEHFVWKQSAMAALPPELAERGYRTWGYFGEEDFGVVETGNLDKRAAGFDLLGVHHSAPRGIIDKLLGQGKPVIAWEVHTRSLRDKLVEQGVTGIMCSNIPYVTTDTARSATDTFATGVRGFGDLPWALAWTHQPEIIPKSSSISLSHPDKASYCMGSMSPIPGDSYSLRFDMRWPEKEPRPGDHAGIAFGQRNDSVYRVREVSEVGGYHLVLRQDGVLELFGRESGSVHGYSLARTPTAPPVSGQWMQFRVDVTPELITCTRTDGPGWSIATNSSLYRGRYFSLCRNYYEFPPVEFRGIGVT